ncbi:MAG: glycosyltransferase, partial [Candidatus Heimdallarchaeota archaeon]|nr:glycosyltransferase [Candidatus Heimdallarchaeota archaeon]
MKIVTFTTLYPNSIQENHGVFVENRLRHLLDSQEIEAQVVAPVRWFPSSNKLFGEYAKFANIPKVEFLNNIRVTHPRFPVIPKIGMSITPFLLATNLYPFLKKLGRNFPFDLIDAHYFYPDGVAAVLIGIALGKPVVITARGSDLNLIPNYSVPRRLIVWTSMKANEIIAVSESLKNVLNGMGVSRAKVTVLRNGVDLNIFRPPTDRRLLRESLNVTGPLILTVGRLDTNKGH